MRFFLFTRQERFQHCFAVAARSKIIRHFFLFPFNKLIFWNTQQQKRIQLTPRNSLPFQREELLSALLIAHALFRLQTEISSLTRLRSMTERQRCGIINPIGVMSLDKQSSDNRNDVTMFIRGKTYQQTRIKKQEHAIVVQRITTQGKPCSTATIFQNPPLLFALLKTNL